MNNRRTWVAGEDAAAAFLAAQGFEILARNWATKMGELDIVAREGRAFVFVEVKTRSKETFASAHECVDYRKQVKLRKTAEAFLQGKLAGAASGGPAECRFDVVSVVGAAGAPEIRHIRNAF